MFAIIKKEVKSYFVTPLAYVVIFFFMILSSIFFWMRNLNYQLAEYTSVLGPMGFLLVFIIPLLTMKILSDDRKNSTFILYSTSPVSITDIVLGKYFAILIVYIVIILFTFIFPLILMIFGSPDLVKIIGGYIGFFLLGASFISVGVFISSLSESQIISAVFTFICLLIIWLIDSISGAFAGNIAKVMRWFSLLSRYEKFNTGILKLDSVLFFISFIFIFLFLTVRVLEKRRWS